jgi:arylsulfatase A-like enzyme
LIHCHDLGDHVGSYAGNSANTPNLDRLAAEGVVFEQYFAASPTCSPSRGAMLTGLMPHRNGLMALASGGHWEVRDDVATLPQLLQQAGYATACYGTWHISAAFTDRGIEEGNQDADCDTAAANAIRYLEQPPADRPFFLMVGFSEPHLPWTKMGPDRPIPETIIVPGYLPDDPRIREELSRFYGEVSRMDAAAGRVLTALAENDLDADTLVLFTSDHGIGMPLAKGTLYDPGTKIPLIVRWTGHVEGGRRYDGLTANVDLLPTVLEAVGQQARIPEDLDGHSLWPFIARDEDVAHPWIFTEQTWHDFYEPMRAVRNRRYKLIRNVAPASAGACLGGASLAGACLAGACLAGACLAGMQIAADILQTTAVDVMRETLRAWPLPALELYDLAQDPWERENLAGRQDMAEIQAALTHALDTWLTQTDDPILEGVVPAPPGYWEHFCAKQNGPGGIPPEKGREDLLTVRWPPGATRHRCAHS